MSRFFERFSKNLFIETKNILIFVYPGLSYAHIKLNFASKFFESLVGLQISFCASKKL